MLTSLGINGPSLIVFVVNFLLLLGVLYMFAYKPILRVMDRRANQIRESLDAAIQEIQGHFADLAITAAERVIERSLDRDAHQELIDRVLQEGEGLRRG